MNERHHQRQQPIGFLEVELIESQAQNGHESRKEMSEKMETHVIGGEVESWLLMGHLA